MASLTDTQISTTYVGLLKTSDNGNLADHGLHDALNITDGIGTSTKLYISKDRVGVGTSAPQSELDVKGQFRITDESDSARFSYMRSTVAGLGFHTTGYYHSFNKDLLFSDASNMNIRNSDSEVCMTFAADQSVTLPGNLISSGQAQIGTSLLVANKIAADDSSLNVGTNGNGGILILYSDTSQRFVKWWDANARLQFQDNTELTLGNSNDLTLVHDSSKTTITNTTGDLELVNSDGEIKLISAVRASTSLTVESAANENITLDYGSPHLGISMHASDSGGWARGMHFLRKSDNALLGAIGGHGGADALTDIWIGASYDAPQLEVQPGNNRVKIFHDATLVSGKKLYFDNAGHTYLSEISDDVLSIVVGGDTMAKFDEASGVVTFSSGSIDIKDEDADSPYMYLKNDNNNNKQTIGIAGTDYNTNTLQLGRDDGDTEVLFTGNASVASGKGFFFDGSNSTAGGTYIKETVANKMTFFAGGNSPLSITNDNVKVFGTGSAATFTVDRGTSDGNCIEVITSHDTNKDLVWVTSGGTVKGKIRYHDSNINDASDRIEIGTSTDFDTLLIRDGEVGIGALPNAPLQVYGSPHGHSQATISDNGSQTYHTVSDMDISSARSTEISGGGGYADLQLGNQSGLLWIYVNSSHRGYFHIYSYGDGSIAVSPIHRVGLNTGLNVDMQGSGFTDNKIRFTNNYATADITVMAGWIGTSPGKLNFTQVT